MADGGGRLHALDLAWLEMEGPGPSIAIGTVAVVEGPAPDTAEIRSLIADRLPRMPQLRREPAPEVGAGLRRPAWVPAEHVDVAAHLHRMAVAPPAGELPVGDPSAGDPSAGESARLGLDAAVARIMEHRLPMDRPLWDAWVVDGLPDGRWALVWRMHHSIADGLGALSVLGHGFDTDPAGGATMSDAVLAAQARAAEAREARARAAQQETGHQPGPETGTALPSGAVGGGVGAALGALRSAVPHLAPALAALVPHRPSPLTGPVGERRVWVSVEVPLAQAKAVGRAFGATVNDVVLAGVTGGFRDLLEHRGEPVHGRVVRNMVPVSVRPAGDADAGNQVSALLGHLPVGLDDPVARLRSVGAAVAHGRQAQEPLAVSLLLGMADRAVPAAVQDVVMATAGRTVPAWFFDTLTTNVPGPQFPVYQLGRRVIGMWPIIPVAGHTCITTGIFSFDGSLDVSVTGDGDHAADVGVVARGVRRAVAELASLAG